MTGTYLLWLQKKYLFFIFVSKLTSFKKRYLFMCNFKINTCMYRKYRNIYVQKETHVQISIEFSNKKKI